MPCRQWEMEDGRRGTEDGGRRTGDGGRGTEDGGRRTGDGGRKTEDGRRKTEDGGRKTEGRALTEEDRVEPDTAYGRSKLAAEELVLHGGYVPEPVVLRLCMVYGPQAKGDREGRGEMGDGRLKMEET